MDIMLGIIKSVVEPSDTFEMALAKIRTNKDFDFIRDVEFHLAWSNYL